MEILGDDGPQDERSTTTRPQNKTHYFHTITPTKIDLESHFFTEVPQSLTLPR